MDIIRLRKAMSRPDTGRVVTAAVLLVALIAGAALSLLSTGDQPYTMVLGVMGLLGCAALFRWPRAGLVLTVFLAVDVLFLGELIDIRVLGGGLELKDLLFGLMGGIIWIRGSLDKRFRSPVTPVSVGLLLFLALALISGIWAQARGIPLLDTLQDLRSLFYYIMFFLVCATVRTRQHARRVVSGLLAVGVVAAGVCILQYVVGPEAIITGGRVASTAETSAVTRVVLPSILFVNSMFVFATCLAVFASRTREKLAYVTMAGLFGVCVILSFSRHLWVADGVILVLLVVALGRRERRQVMVAALIALLLLAGGVALLNKLPGASFSDTDLVGALRERVAEVAVGDITQLKTIRGRLGEVALAWEWIRQYPYIGIGMGAAYYGASDSPWDPGSVARHPYLPRYVHNGYVWIALKMGLFALALYLGLALLFVVRGYRVFRRIGDPYGRAIALSCTLTLIALLVIDLVHPAFVSTGGAVTVGMVWGLGETVRLGFRDRRIVADTVAGECALTDVECSGSEE